MRQSVGLAYARLLSLRAPPRLLSRATVDLHKDDLCEGGVSGDTGRLFFRHRTRKEAPFPLHPANADDQV
jgi:hypothetical protein